MRRAAQTTISDPAPRRRGSRALVALALAVALAVVGTLGLSTLAAPPAAAQAVDDDATEPAMTKQERKLAEKDARIREYLRKKEERRILREQRKTDATAAAERTTAAPRTERVASVATPRPTTKKSKQKPARRPATRGRSTLPRGLMQAQGNVRSSSLGEDPTVKSYLQLIDAQGASPYQLAAFGNFIAQSGLVVDALAYYDVALKLERDDPTLWINMGTLQRQYGDSGAAMEAFHRALRLDPNSAVAHYNLGAVHDQNGRYDDALDAYRMALTLDPSLGDPASNPQAANNDRLLAVKLMLYHEQAGSLGLPLQAVDANRNGP